MRSKKGGSRESTQLTPGEGKAQESTQLMPERKKCGHTPPRFFLEASAVPGDQVVLVGDMFRHAKAKRLSKGELFEAVCGDTIFTVKVSQLFPDRLIGAVIGADAAERSLAICLYASLLKGKKFDLVVEKAAELGVSYVVPVVTSRTVVRLDEAKASDRRARWQKIAAAAAEQSSRTQVPSVGQVIAFADLMSLASGPASPFLPSPRLLAHERREETRSLARALEGATGATVLVGPEGGLDADEVEAALRCGFVPVSLGPYILKAATASMAAVALIVHQLTQELTL